MKSIFVLSFLFVLTLAAPGKFKNDDPVAIVNYQSFNNGLGPYNFAFETADGTKRQEEAVLINPNDPESGLIVRGSYSYPGEDGNIITVTYEADENGYRVIEPAQQGGRRG
ncbi:endocuticle structural glycoprotein ABD-5-like [Arctopsyche grandis]|uniref:endocuticle structural glycoprotein ABD-5-like n=1 Tax=Arctopsyche grandis TaxID=121162 RepID=UPI00406D80A0